MKKTRGLFASWLHEWSSLNVKSGFDWLSSVPGCDWFDCIGTGVLDWITWHEVGDGLADL